MHTVSRLFTFGVVGGYGETGRFVVSILHKHASGGVLIGGRDARRGNGLASELGAGVEAARVDVLDAASLDEFCGRCSVVINCAGPVKALEDRVAQAAFRRRCHYIDAAGMALIKERMQRHDGEISDRGLSFVVSAGWMPGLTELLPGYAVAVARTRMDVLESVTSYFGDAGEWSDSALRDAASFIRRGGIRKPGHFRKGEWIRSKMADAFRKVDLGAAIGGGRFCLFSTPEMDELGRHLVDCEVRNYTYLSGFRPAVASTLLATLPLSEGRAVRLVRSVFRSNRLPKGGFLVVEVVGTSQGRRSTLKTQVTFERGGDYEIHGRIMATVALMISEDKGVKSGVRYLADAVDPIGLMTKLREAGIDQTEDFT